MNKIPVYYHIPKCGGTYVITKCREILRFHNNGLSAIRIQDKENNQTIVRCFVKKNIELDIDIYNDYDCLLKHVNNILFITIEASGIKLRDNILNNIKNTYEFMTIRDPFDRIQSMYNYITSEASKHEPSHGSIKDKKFEEYMENPNYEKNWISLQFSTEKETLINKLKNINIYKMQNIEKSISDCFKACHPDIDCSRYNANLVNMHRNTIKPKKISINDVPNEVINKFLKYNDLDYFIYDKCCNLE